MRPTHALQQQRRTTNIDNTGNFQYTPQFRFGFSSSLIFCFINVRFSLRKTKTLLKTWTAQKTSTRDYFDATASNWNTSAQSRPLASFFV